MKKKLKMKELKVSKDDLRDIVEGASTKGWALIEETFRSVFLKKTVILTLLILLLPLIMGGWWASTPSTIQEREFEAKVQHDEWRMTINLPEFFDATKEYNLTGEIENGGPTRDYAEAKVQIGLVTRTSDKIYLNPGEKATFTVNFSPFSLVAEDQALVYAILDRPKSWNDPDYVHWPISAPPPDRYYDYKSFNKPVYGQGQQGDWFPLDNGAVRVQVSTVNFVEFPGNLTVNLVITNRNPYNVTVNTNVEIEKTVKEPDPVFVQANNTTLIRVVLGAQEIGYGYKRLLQVFAWLEGSTEIGATHFRIDVLAASENQVSMSGKLEDFITCSAKVPRRIDVGTSLKIDVLLESTDVKDNTAWVNLTVGRPDTGFAYIPSSGPVTVPAGGSVTVTLQIDADVFKVGENSLHISLASQGETDKDTGAVSGWDGDPLVLEGLELYTQITGGAYLSFFVMFIALIYSGPMFSSELENRTLPMLVTRPLRKVEILLYKFLGYVLSTTILVIIPIFLLYGIVGFKIGGGPALENITVPFGFAFASFLGIVVFGTIFTFIGLLTKRPIMFATFYLLIWEVSQHITSSLLGGEVCGLCGLGMLQKGTVTHFTKSVAHGLIEDKIPNASELLGLNTLSFSADLDGYVSSSIATPLGYAVLTILVVSIIFLILGYVVFSFKDIN